MSEAEVVEQLVQFTELLLAGVSVFFTVISAYVAALNYFIGTANLAARMLAFVFICVILAMLAVIMLGAQLQHDGLIARLLEIQEESGLSAAGRAALANAAAEDMGGFSVDTLVRYGVWGVMALVGMVFFYLTFLYRWKADVTPVQLVEGE
jgi:hypothetical protein